MLAATIDFQFEVQAVAFIEGGHACALYGADVDECVRLTIVTLDEAEALHGIEELDRTAGAFTSQLALRTTAIAATEAAAVTTAEAATVAAEAAGAGFTGLTRTIDNRKGLALDL